VHDVVVTLVHGTFARRASWTKDSSQLSRALRQAHFEIETFRWSASNSHHARLAAGNELSEHLIAQARRCPGALQVVIAHSHGGNVALYAARELQLADNHEGVRVITLATPFLHVREKRLPQLMIISWMLIGLLCLVSGAVIIPLTGGIPGSRPATSLPIMGLGVVFFMHAFLVFRAAFRGGWRLNPDDLSRWVEEWIPRWLEELHSPSMNVDQLMVVRASGDEATSVLIAGQFFALITTWLTTASRWRGWYALPVLAYIGCYIVIPDIEAASNALLLLLFVIVAVAGVPLFIATSLVMTASLTFGWDSPLASLFAFMSAESTPPGSVHVIQLQPSPKPGATDSGQRRKRRLVHSSLYDDPQVIHHVLTGIRAWRDDVASRHGTDADG
jgi:hypothetical protein